MTTVPSSAGEAPVVVIGSGPTGAMAATKLVSRGINVVMLDSGTEAPSGVVVRAAGNTVFRKKSFGPYSTDRLAGNSKNVSWTSSLSHGGLSNYWTAAVPRFAPQDFTEGGRLDQRYEWPLTYDELRRYYDEAEHHLKVTGGTPILGVPPAVQRHHHRVPQDWAEVAARATDNGDGLGALPMAKGDPWMIALRGTEFASYHCVVRPLLSRPNFSLRSGAHVRQILWNASEGRATAVEYEDRESGALRQLPASAVIVTAGTVDTTMILLRSTSDDFPNGLGNSRGLIGRYLHDHPREWWFAKTERPMRALAHPMYLARADYDTSAPLLATSHTIGLKSPVERLRTFVAAKTDHIGVQVFGTMVPKPDVGISLPNDTTGAIRASARDQRPELSLSYDDDAVRNIESSRERLRDVLGSAGLSISIPGPFHALTPGESVHLAGTVRMHNDPEFGVLDRWNRMHDVPNVLVCDLSCFTTGPEKNPTPTAMALALRAAERLANELTTGTTREPSAPTNLVR